MSPELIDYRLHNDGPIRLGLQDQVARVGQMRLVGEDTSLDVSGTVGLADGQIALHATGNRQCRGTAPRRAAPASCPPGFHDDGATCRLENIKAKPSYGRGVGVVPTAIATVRTSSKSVLRLIACSRIGGPGAY